MRNKKQQTSETNEQYVRAGTYIAVLAKERKRAEKKGVTVWGYEPTSVLTQTTLRARIRYMRAAIKSGKFGADGSRRLQFAKHHLCSLIRKLDDLAEAA
jgi:hypothetical protein